MFLSLLPTLKLFCMGVPVRMKWLVAGIERIAIVVLLAVFLIL